MFRFVEQRFPRDISFGYGGYVQFVMSYKYDESHVDSILHAVGGVA